MIISRNRWLVCRSPRPGAQLRLLAIPSAGSGSGLFHVWDAALPRWVELWSVMAPGRESRYSEPVPGSLLDFVEAIGDALGGIEQVPLVVFGHSMGGRIAFELARQLGERGQPLPLHLFLSSIAAPSRYGREPPKHLLGDVDLLMEVRRSYGGFPPEVERYPELLRAALRVLREDLHALETYQKRASAPLPVAISALGGKDDPSVSVEDLRAWEVETTGGFELLLFKGDHRYVESGAEAVLSFLVPALKDLGRSGGSSPGASPS